MFFSILLLSTIFFISLILLIRLLAIGGWFGLYSKIDFKKGIIYFYHNGLRVHECHFSIDESESEIKDRYKIALYEAKDIIKKRDKTDNEKKKSRLRKYIMRKNGYY